MDNQEKPKCECCGTSKEVELVIDPYTQDICGEDIEMYLCTECYTQRVMDI